MEETCPTCGGEMVDDKCPTCNDEETTAETEDDAI